MMKSLANAVNGDVFETGTVDEAELVKEYYERNERKKGDEKWLKDNKSKVEAILARHDKTKMDFGDIRVSVVIPDTSKFDPDKLYQFFESIGKLNDVTKQVIDEDKVAALIESGEVDLDRVKEAAWVESKGTPRLTVTKITKGERK